MPMFLFELVFVNSARYTNHVFHSFLNHQVEGETYEFRVRAINAGGVSEASNVVGPITCKARNVRPRIDRNSMMEIRCRAGVNFYLIICLLMGHFLSIFRLFL